MDPQNDAIVESDPSAASASSSSLSFPNIHIVMGNEDQKDDAGNIPIAVLLDPPADASSTRQPLVLAACVDVSGSMDNTADLQGGETMGHSILGLVQHALYCIIATATDEDALGIVSFSDSARVVLPLTHMTVAGKQLAKDAVASLHANGSTNLWGGIEAAASLLEVDAAAAGGGGGGAQTTNNNKHYALIALTDGQPNVSPPRGELGELRRKQFPLPYTLHTFGFGYGLDSSLLAELATEGNGGYSFIPDASMIGTVFINTLSSLRSAYGTQAVLSVPPRVTFSSSATDSLVSSGSSNNTTTTLIITGPGLQDPRLNHCRVTESSTAEAVAGTTDIHLGTLSFGTQRGIVLRGRVVVDHHLSGVQEPPPQITLRYRNLLTPSVTLLNPCSYINSNNTSIDAATATTTTTSTSSGAGAGEASTSTSTRAVAVGTVAGKLQSDLAFHMARESFARSVLEAHVLAQRGATADAIKVLTEFIDKLRGGGKGAASVGAGGNSPATISTTSTTTSTSSAGSVVSCLRAPGDRRVADIIRDADGQALLAVTRPDYFAKWGVHYIPSLARAHSMQVCNNFKDPGVQLYGTGSLFQRLRDEGDVTFKSLPPPPTAENQNGGMQLQRGQPQIQAYGRRRHMNTNSSPSSSPSSSPPSSRSYSPGPPVDMSRYMDPNGGCFDGNAMVLVPKEEEEDEENGEATHDVSAAITHIEITSRQPVEVTAAVENTTETRILRLPVQARRVKDICRGDKVMTPEGPATVQTVLRTDMRPGCELVKLHASGLILTPYHPIRRTAKVTHMKGSHSNESEAHNNIGVENSSTSSATSSATFHPSSQPFVFPRDLPVEVATTFRIEGDEPFSVYDFVLDKGHVVFVAGGIECITLAHGFETDPVAAHPFFGTSESIKALARCVGYQDGFVVIGPKGGVMRDRSTGLICDYAQIQ